MWFEKEKEMVSCKTCGCLLFKENAQKIPIERFYSLIPDELNLGNEYYCKIHEVKYDKKVSGSLLGNIYYKVVKCDENGKLIK